MRFIFIVLNTFRMSNSIILSISQRVSLYWFEAVLILDISRSLRCCSDTHCFVTLTACQQLTGRIEQLLGNRSPEYYMKSITCIQAFREQSVTVRSQFSFTFIQESVVSGSRGETHRWSLYWGLNKPSICAVRDIQKVSNPNLTPVQISSDHSFLFQCGNSDLFNKYMESLKKSVPDRNLQEFWELLIQGTETLKAWSSLHDESWWFKHVFVFRCSDTDQQWWSGQQHRLQTRCKSGIIKHSPVNIYRCVCCKASLIIICFSCCSFWSWSRRWRQRRQRWRMTLVMLMIWWVLSADCDWSLESVLYVIVVFCSENLISEFQVFMDALNCNWCFLYAVGHDVNPFILWNQVPNPETLWRAYEDVIMAFTCVCI